MYRTLRQLLVIALLAWLLPASAITQPLTLPAANPPLFFLADPTNTLTLAQVMSAEYHGRFQTIPQHEYNRRISTTHSPAWWVRLDIQPGSSHDLYLLVDTPVIARVDAFIVDPQASPPTQPMGNLRKEGLWQHLPTLKLPSRDHPYRVYLRASNHSLEIRYLPLRLLSGEALYQNTARNYLLYGGVITGLLVLASYNLFVFASLRNWSYLALIVSLTSQALAVQRIYGVIPWLSFVSNPDSPWFTGVLHLLMVSVMQFWRLLLDSQKLMPVADKIFIALLVLGIGTTPIIFWQPQTELLSFTLVIAMSLANGISSLLLLYQRNLAMRSFALGFFLFIGCATPITLWQVNLLPDADAALLCHLFSVGTLLAAILLSLTLAEHTRQLRVHAERAEAESQAKDKFLATMSHELRTPMNSIVAAMALFKQGSELPTRQREYLTQMETASRHILGLVDNILDLSRLEQASITLHPQPFHLPALLDKLQQIAGVQAQAKQLTLRIQPPIDPLPWLWGDEQRLAQVLLNLLGNAIKFTERGEVVLSVQALPGKQPDSLCLSFVVADTGIGIPQAEQQRLFQPFTQLDNQRTRHYGGSGLGLAISQQLVSIMGGTLALESQPGAGCRFLFSLEFPLEATPPGHPSVTREAGSPVSGAASLHILLVDDEPLNQFFGKELLQTLGIQASIAASGQEAIQQLQTQPFDLVFMDVSMPGMDGYETTRRIRCHPRFAHLPIIALTAHAIAGERERCLAAGMNDYLTKPLELAQLREMLKQWAGSTKPASTPDPTLLS